MSKIDIEKFEEKYRDLINQLANLPKKSMERRKVLESTVEYAVFSEEALKAYFPKYYSWLVYQGNLEKKVEAADDYKMFDYLAFMVALDKSINEYTGISEQGKSYTFYSSVKMNYSSCNGEENIANDSRIKNKNVEERIRKIAEAMVNYCTEDELRSLGKKDFCKRVREVCKEAHITYVSAKKNYDFITERVFDISMLRLDSPLSNEDDVSTLVDVIGDVNAQTAAKTFENLDQLKYAIQAILTSMENGTWPSNKVANEWVKLLLSHNLVCELKANLGRDGKGKPVFVVNNQGNWNVYDKMLQLGLSEAVYDKLMHQEYLDYLYVTFPCDWEQMYRKYLKEIFVYLYETKTIKEFLGDGFNKTAILRKQEAFRKLMHKLCS